MFCLICLFCFVSFACVCFFTGWGSHVTIYQWCIGPDHREIPRHVQTCSSWTSLYRDPPRPPTRYRDVNMKHVRLASGRLASYRNAVLFLLLFLNNCNERQKTHWVFVQHDPNECSIDLTTVSVHDSVTDRFYGPESASLMWLSRRDGSGNLMISVIWAINRGNIIVWRNSWNRLVDLCWNLK